MTELSEFNRVCSLTKLWGCLLKELLDNDFELNEEKVEPESLCIRIQYTFLHACIWSLCITVANEYRKPLN